MQNVRRLEPIIQQTLLNLFSRLEKWGHMDVPAPMNTAYKATTKDIIHAYAFGDGEKCLEMDDLNEAFFESMAPVWTNHLGTYFPIIIEIMNILPPRLVTMIMPRVAFFVRFVQVCLMAGDSLLKETEAVDRVSMSRLKPFATQKISQMGEPSSTKYYEPISQILKSQANGYHKKR